MHGMHSVNSVSVATRVMAEAGVHHCPYMHMLSQFDVFHIQIIPPVHIEQFYTIQVDNLY